MQKPDRDATFTERGGSALVVAVLASGFLVWAWVADALANIDTLDRMAIDVLGFLLAPAILFVLSLIVLPGLTDPRTAKPLSRRALILANIVLLIFAILFATGQLDAFRMVTRDGDFLEATRLRGNIFLKGKAGGEISIGELFGVQGLGLCVTAPSQTDLSSVEKLSAPEFKTAMPALAKYNASHRCDDISCEYERLSFVSDGKVVRSTDIHVADGVIRTNGANRCFRMSEKVKIGGGDILSLNFPD